MKPGILLYREWKSHIALLDMAQRGALLTAVFDYDGTESAVPSDPIVAMAFSFMRAAFDADEKRYSAKTVANQRNGRLGGRPNDENNPTNPVGSLGYQNNHVVNLETQKSERLKKEPKKALSVSVSDKLSDSGSVSVSGSVSPEGEVGARTRFTPPTIAEVSSYVAERQSQVDPQEFMDFYASKGWLVGKVPMKDWKAACRNAEKWDRWSGAEKRKSGVSPPDGNVEWMKKYIQQRGTEEMP